MEVFLGTICAFGFNFAPRGWALCNGAILSISQNAALFSLLGTNFGGNGTSNFGLPNLQGNAAMCMGTNQQSSYIIGESGGADNVTINSSNLPPHMHAVTMSINAYNGTRPPSSSTSPVSNYPGMSSGGINTYNTASSTGSFLKPASVVLGQSGGSIPINISDPALVMNYSIALSGIFPSRQ